VIPTRVRSVQALGVQWGVQRGGGRLACSSHVKRDATLLLALPFSKKVVRPDPRGPVWKRKPRRGQEGALQDAPDPAGVPELTDAQLRLPEAVGHLLTALSWLVTRYAHLLMRGAATPRHAYFEWAGLSARSSLLRVLPVLPQRSNHLPRVHLPVDEDGHPTAPRRYRRSRTLIRLRL